MGLNALEAEVYTHLLKASPLTGYAVAKALGKPAANVYKAIETLSDKGAVLVDEGGSRLCRAVPAKQFLARLERDFSRHRKDAEAVLSRFPAPAEDARIYHLQSRTQVIEHCRRLLAEARREVHIDIYPEPLADLRNEIAGAAQRGVQVVIKTYAPAEIPGVEILIEPDPTFVLDRWPVQWVNVAIDHSRFTLALLTADGEDVVQAIWSASPYVSYIHHGRLACELAYTALKVAFERGASHEELLHTFAHTKDYIVLDSPGYDRLLHQIAHVEVPAKEKK